MSIELSQETRTRCEEIIARYPSDWKQAAILPLLHLLLQNLLKKAEKLQETLEKVLKNV